MWLKYFQMRKTDATALNSLGALLDMMKYPLILIARVLVKVLVNTIGDWTAGRWPYLFDNGESFCALVRWNMS